MKAQDIGSVPVVDSHETKKLVGIVTDRDLALKVVAEGLDSRQTRDSRGAPGRIPEQGGPALL